MSVSRRRLRRRRRLRDSEGSQAIELAIIGPSLIVLIFFVVQAALYFYGRSVALQSAREGVSQLRLSQDQASFDAAEPAANADVVAFATRIGSGALDKPKMTDAYDPVGGQVRVTVTGTTISLIPFATFTVTESARGAVETFK